MAEFAKGDVDPEYDEVDATLDAAGFTDWSADDDTSNITIEQGGNNEEGDGLYYAESVRSDQLVEIFVSPLGGSEHTSIEAMLENDIIKYGFDWKALMNKITSHKDEILLIVIINYIRNRSKSTNITTPEQGNVLFNEIIENIEAIRSDDINLQPQLENDALLYCLPDYLGLTNWSDDEDEGKGIIIPPAAVALESNEEREARLQAVRNELGIEETLSSSASSSSSSLATAGVTSGKPIAGATYPYSQAPGQHTWSKTDHQNFQLRIGPNYDWNKKKAPSSSPLYEVFAVDIFSSESRIDHITEKIQMPSSAIKAMESNTHPHVPAIFVVQVQIPSEKPPMFSTVENGPGWSIVMYFKITDDTLRKLNNNEGNAAVKLFSKWCEHAHEDAAWRGRFKVIASCSNLTELGMPSIVTSYNAKPVLIRKTSTIFKTPQYIETCIHVFKFANMAKSPIHMCTSRCGLMDMEIGFTIEGRTDEELPECLIGCAKITKPQESQTKKMVV